MVEQVLSALREAEQRYLQLEYKMDHNKLICQLWQTISANKRQSVWFVEPIEQSFNLTSDVITQPMLNNGITLDSSVEVQNGECSVSGCWGGQGGADSFTIRLQIRDSDNEILATTSQTRTNVTGINGEYFQNTLSYTGIGSNIGNIFIITNFFF